MLFSVVSGDGGLTSWSWASDVIWGYLSPAANAEMAVCVDVLRIGLDRRRFGDAFFCGEEDGEPFFFDAGVVGVDGCVGMDFLAENLKRRGDLVR